MKRELVALGLAVAAGTAIWLATRGIGPGRAVLRTPAATISPASGSPRSDELVEERPEESGPPERTAADIPPPPVSAEHVILVDSSWPERAALEGSIVPIAGLPMRLVRPVLARRATGTDPGAHDELSADPCARNALAGAAWVDEQGRFDWYDLAPRTVAVRLMLHGELEPVLVVPDVVLRAGETTRDPRLQSIKLEQSVFLHRIEVVGPEGQPLPDAVALRTDASSDCFPGYRQHGIERGEIVIASLSPTIAVAVLAPEHRVARIPDLGASARIVMQPAYSVHVQLADGSTDLSQRGLTIQPRDGVYLVLDPEDSGLGVFGEDPRIGIRMPDAGLGGARDHLIEIRQELTSAVSPEGKTSFVVAEAGRYRPILRFEAVRQGEEAPEGRSLLFTLPAEDAVDVRDTHGPQTFDVRPNLGFLDFLLESGALDR